MSGDGKPRLSEGAIVLLVGIGMAICFAGAMALQSGRSLEEEEDGDDAAGVTTEVWSQRVAKLENDLDFAQQDAADQQTTVDRLNAALSQLQGEVEAAGGGQNLVELQQKLAEALEHKDRLQQLNAEMQAKLAERDRPTVEEPVVVADAGSQAELPEARGSQDVDPRVLSDVRVSNVQPDLELAILDVGRVHGIRPGMSFRVVRDHEVVARVTVDDVRDEMTGATIQSTEKNLFPQVGDRAILVTSN